MKSKFSIFNFQFSILFALVFVAQVIFAASVTPAADIPAYWESVNSKAGAALWTAVSSATNKGYKSIGYNGLYDAYLKTDVYPSDSTGKAGKIWDMYGECLFSTGKTCGSYKGVCDCYNREHSIPQSWWGGGTGGIGNDIFHVLPTDGKVNGVRSNYEYGEVNGGTNWVGNKYGAASSWSTDKKTIASAAGETVNGTGNVFEPKPQYKGDLARGLMGTIVKWQSDVTQGNNFFNDIYTPSSNFGLTKKAVVLLMKWHREDPVSQKEIDRNNGIQQTQGNRNPFIDYPYLAEYIWGEHAGETIDMSKLMPSTDPEFIPGVSDGWRGGVTPPSPQTPKFGVNWSVNGEVVSVDSIAENKNITELPETPVSCSAESNVFMGWTDAPIEGISDEAPAVLLKAAADFPAVTADVTYYAVFARAAEMEPSLPATYTFDADNQEGWACTASNKGSFWLLDQGKTIVSPTVDLMGLTSIVVKMRTYGGTQYDQLKIDEETGTLTTIEATGGKTMTEYTWNNNLYIAGASTLTFSCGNAGSDKGIGIQSITINGTGAADIYIRFITSCQSTTEVELVPTAASARKHLINGHIYIQTTDGLFTITGQKVK